MNYTDIANALADVDTFLDPEVLAAYADNLGLSPDDVDDWKGEAEEAYQGDYTSDEEFARELADALGLIREDAEWPNSYIDWGWAARDLMFDYFESNGHYFRNL